MSTTGQVDLRAENVSRIVDGFALPSYKFKQLVQVQSSSAWRETYYQETAADLEASASRTVEGVSRLANFPYAEVIHTKVHKDHKKFAIEGVISYEDATTDAIDVISRTLLRIARAVTKSVDAEIWDVITESQTPVSINTVAVAVGSEWDSATLSNRDPIQNILDGMKEISEDNYDPYSNGYLCLNPKNFSNLMGNANVRNAGQFYTADATRNGKVGRLLGLTIIVSNNVTADKAAIIIAKECGTWQAAKGLTTETIYDPGIKYTIRSYEIGMCQLTNPEAVCLITNTDA